MVAQGTETVKHTEGCANGSCPCRPQPPKEIDGTPVELADAVQSSESSPIFVHLVPATPEKDDLRGWAFNAITGAITPFQHDTEGRLMCEHLVCAVLEAADCVGIDSVVVQEVLR